MNIDLGNNVKPNNHFNKNKCNEQSPHNKSNYSEITQQKAVFNIITSVNFVGEHVALVFIGLSCSTSITKVQKNSFKIFFKKKRQNNLLWIKINHY